MDGVVDDSNSSEWSISSRLQKKQQGIDGGSPIPRFAVVSCLKVSKKPCGKTTTCFGVCNFI
jgi:hypothetical protein